MTEKNYNPQQRTSKTMKKQQNVDKTTEIVDTKKIEDKKQETKVEEKKEKKIEQKRIKKDEAVVNGISLPISTKDSVAICKFIRHKSIDKAISDLEEVSKLKKAIPMSGEIPHRKGKGMMAGRYMTKPVGFFIRLLKDLKSNANANGLDEPIIVESVPNRASRPYGRFGSVKRKRTHIKVRAVEKSKLKQNKKKKTGGKN
ncbi:hypothetical protein M0R19_06985 [Candidatus Pacearchaeota archaeon]|jgi:ribosomal protein L22|nr:hypothetical protein [Candidatus Pacearchaeota archaeon]